MIIALLKREDKADFLEAKLRIRERGLASGTRARAPTRKDANADRLCSLHLRPSNKNMLATLDVISPSDISLRF